jgi:hypothetical protein
MTGEFHAQSVSFLLLFMMNDSLENTSLFSNKLPTKSPQPWQTCSQLSTSKRICKTFKWTILSNREQMQAAIFAVMLSGCGAAPTAF